MTVRWIKPASALLLSPFLLSLGGCSGGGSSDGGSSSSSSSSSGGSSSSSGAVAYCANLPQATSLIGQPGFTTNTPDNGGISGLTLGGVQGAVAVYSNPASPSVSPITYVADTANNRILGFGGIPKGINTTAANFIIGQSTASDQTPGTGPEGGNPIKFANPSKISTANVSGHAYVTVADSGNNRVLIWNKPPMGNTAPDVVVGQPDFTHASANQPNATPSAAGLDHPTAAVITSGGQLVVVDKSNNRVLIWNKVPTENGTPADLEQGQVATDTTGATTCTANTGTAGYCFTTNVPSIDQFNGTTNILAMRQPSDAWTDGSNLLVTDTGNNRVLYWTSVPGTMNQLPDNLLGATQFGSYNPAGGAGTQNFNAPWGVASNGTNVFVADAGNNRIMEFQAYVTTPRNGPAANDVFGQKDFTHITQNDPDQNGAVGDQHFNPATNGVTAGTMSSPQGLYVDAASNILLVSDNANSRVLGFPASAGVDGTESYIPCSP
ncbi:hypothetical protein [Nevskia soli]|uniref:hypothetical protein n=1 Tax=Nevskia soli TaxID=418856 RepID=UPI00068D87CA|nr:hypothetical protein [Nevskia soli]